jgi:hypothetical protein
MLDSRSSACRIPDNDKVRDSLKVSNPPIQIVLSQALGGTVFGKNKLVFGIFTTGCPPAVLLAESVPYSGGF